MLTVRAVFNKAFPDQKSSNQIKIVSQKAGISTISVSNWLKKGIIPEKHWKFFVKNGISIEDLHFVNEFQRSKKAES